MSVGNAVGAVVGAVIGFYVGGPAGAIKGASYGYTLGGMVDPPKGPNINGPRLSDLTLQSSTYNSVIPRTYGTVALTGNIFWLENNKYKEVSKKSKSGGKGGGGGASVKTYSYYATFAVGLCEGPIVGVRRIWAGPKLIYDASLLDNNSLLASNNTSKLFTLYLGDDTQLPDPRIQSTLGVANTPAYRGLAYLVFKDYPLKDHGNSLAGAQIKVEIVKNGFVDTYVQNYSTTNLTAVAWTDMIWNGKVFCMVGNFGGCAISKDGVIWTQSLIGGVTTWNWDGVIWNGKKFVAWNDKNYPNCRTAISTDGLNWTISAALPNTQWTIQSMGFHKAYFFVIGGSACAMSTDGLVWVQQAALPINGNWMKVKFNGSLWISLYSNNVITSLDGTTWTGLTSVSGLNPGEMWLNLEWNGAIFLAVGAQSSLVTATSPNGITWTAHTFPIPYPGKGLCWNGELFLMGGEVSHFFMSYDGINWITKSSISAANCTGVAWNGAIFACAYRNYSKVVDVYPRQLTISNPTLKSVIDSECLKTDILQLSDIVTTLMTQPVRGYRIGRVSSLRTALELLQATWPFDIVQSGYQIKFKPRGSASSVVTIPASDLGSTEGE